MVLKTGEGAITGSGRGQGCCYTPSRKNQLAPNVNSAKAEKLGPDHWLWSQRGASIMVLFFTSSVTSSGHVRHCFGPSFPECKIIPVSECGDYMK